MAELKAGQAADYLIRLARGRGKAVSNQKLQKLLYYAQAWHLALHGGPLFDDPLEAWTHGPVQPEVYARLKRGGAYGWSPLDHECPRPDLPPEAAAHLDEVYEVYGSLSDRDLERLTRSEEPCRRAREGLALDAPGGGVIDPGQLREFFRRRLGNE